MENKNDYFDYWNEVQTLQDEVKPEDYLEDNFKYLQEGEQESDWLRIVGFGHLSDAFQQGREISNDELDASLSLLPEYQAETVKKRVRTLNQTIRSKHGQQKSRHKKPDIREVFRDIETSSTGTRSRSATPDSLDSTDEESVGLSSPLSRSPGAQKVVTDWPNRSNTKSVLRRTPSVPIAKINVRSSHDIFRKSGHWSMAGLQRVDIASNTEGIELLGYQRFGTIYNHKGNKDRMRSGSDPITVFSSVNVLDLKPSSSSNHPLSNSDEHLWQSTVNEKSSLSFEQCFQHTDVVQPSLDTEGLVCIDDLSDAKIIQLKPLIWLELSALFDQHSVPFHKRKLNKRKRKESGNVFGVSLSSLVMRDQSICEEEGGTVPYVLKLVLNELETRCCQEEGILRLAGHKQRVETLCADVEQHLYSRPQVVCQALQRATCHELTALLKRLLHKLPQPLLTSELIHLFYSSHALPNSKSLVAAFNLLVLLLPVEHRGTLRALLHFLLAVVQQQASNRMSLHNVAMIMAPSVFLPASLQSLHKADLDNQVHMAAISCRLMETLLQCNIQLWHVPSRLLLQACQPHSKHKYKKKSALVR